MAGPAPTTALWYRVAALRPRLRPHVIITRQSEDAERWYLVADPIHNRFHRFGTNAYAVIAMMDGRRSLDAIWRALEELGDARPTQDDIIQLLAQLDEADLLATDRRPDYHELATRVGASHRARWMRRLAAPLYLQLPLIDPGRFLRATAPLLRPFWSPVGLLLWLAVVGWGAVEAWLNWDALSHDLGDRILATDNIVILVLVFPLLKVLHELGHAYATAIFGGEVREAGVLTMVLLPMPYVEVSASTRFSRWRRIVVAASGMLVETFVAALALAMWLRMQPGPMRAAAFDVMAIAGVSTLVFNGNPLLRFDAYYILSDLLGVSNLASRAGRFYIHLVNCYAFGLDGNASPARNRRERVTFLLYAPLSYGYRLTVMFSIALLLATLWKGLGAVLAVWTMTTAIALPLARGAMYVLTDPLLRSRRFRALAVTGGALACLYGLLFALNLPYGTVAEGVVWSPEQAQIHAGVEGTVVALTARLGTRLSSGQEVAELTDPLLVDRVAVMRSERREIELRYQAVEGRDEVQTKMLADQRGYVDAALRDLTERLGQLAVTSPAAGELLIEAPDDLPGRVIKRGDLIGFAVDERASSIRVVVPQSAIDEVRGDTRWVDLRFADDPFVVRRVPAVTREVPVATRTLPSAALSVPGGGNISVEPGGDPKKPQTVEVVFEMDLPLPEGVPPNRLGERVTVRFDHGRRTLGTQIGRRLRQIFLERLEL